MIQVIDEVSANYHGTLSQPFIEFAKRQLVNASMYHDPERRAETRHPMMLPALVVPIDENHEACGSVIEVITRDVASTSIGLFHEVPIRGQRLAIHLRLANTEVDLALKIIWSSEMGPFFGSAGWYTKKLDAFPADIEAWREINL